MRIQCFFKGHKKFKIIADGTKDNLVYQKGERMVDCYAGVLYLCDCGDEFYVGPRVPFETKEEDTKCVKQRKAKSKKK